MRSRPAAALPAALARVAGPDSATRDSPSGRQVTGPEREQIATRLRAAYAQGASIRDLMEQTGRSYGWTHRLLRESGAVLRGRGGAHPARNAATVRKS